MRSRPVESNGAENPVLLERIAQARKRAGLTLAEASRKLGFNNYQTLAAMEKGNRKILASNLLAMARLYRTPLDYFFEPEIPPEPEPVWRMTGDTDATPIGRQFISFLRQYRELERLLGLPEHWKKLRTLYKKQHFDSQGFALAQRLASEISKNLALGPHPAFDLPNVCENDLGIKILHLSLPSGISGASVADDELGPGVLINTNDAPWRRNFDLAHELFHIITWDVFPKKEPDKPRSADKKTRPEQYADAFASALLLPGDHLMRSLGEMAGAKGIGIADIIELAKEFGVSTEAVLWRLVSLRILSKKQVDFLLADPHFRDRDRQLRKSPYPESPPSKYPDRYVYLACKCLMEGRISRGLFAKYLDVELYEVDSFLEENGFREENYEKIPVAGRRRDHRSVLPQPD
jgi:Zn-dependent peptidase ImmA (M78 family)/DNA-binding XRE family transcriptional regulator